MKEMLLQRIQELRVALEQSAQQHNALIGRMAETQFLYDECIKKEQGANQLEIPPEIPPEIAAMIPVPNCAE